MSPGGLRVCALVCGAGLTVAAGVSAAPEPLPPGPHPEAIDGETPAIDDEVICVVILQTERTLQRTAAVGTQRHVSAEVKSTARVIHGSIGQMMTKIERYAARRGYAATPALPAEATAADTDFGRLITGLESLRGHEFDAVYLNVVHNFLGEMVAIVAGAEQMAEDPGLKTLLGGMQSDFAAHRMRIDDLLTGLAPPHGPAAPGAPPAPLPR